MDTAEHNEITKESDVIDKAFNNMSIAVKQAAIKAYRDRENLEKATALCIFDKIHELDEKTANKSENVRWIKLQLLIGKLKKEFGRGEKRMKKKYFDKSNHWDEDKHLEALERREWKRLEKYKERSYAVEDIMDVSEENACLKTKDLKSEELKSEIVETIG